MINRRWVNRGPPNYPFTLNRESLQARGLIAWWPTIGSRGANRLQGFVRGIDAISEGAGFSWGMSSVLGASPRFADNNGRISPDETLLNLSSDTVHSVSIWIQPEQLPADRTLTMLDLRSTSNFSDHPRISISTFGGSDEIRCFSANSSFGNEIVISTSEAEVGVAMHIVAVYDPTGSGMRLYINGQEEGSALTFTPFAGKVIDEITIGTDKSGDRPYIGMMSDVRIYNRALTPIEGHQLYAPQTRGELYQPIQRDAFAFVAAAGLGPVYPGRNHPSRNVSLRL